MSGLLSVSDARQRLLKGAEALPAETVPIQLARGRVLAADVVARRRQPLHDMSAMDGYAVSHATPVGEAEFAIVGTAPAGERHPRALAASETLRIYTGGIVPEGARVVVQEQAVRDGDSVRLTLLEGDADHVRPAGGDFAAGDVLLAAGERVHGARLALLAAADRPTVEVARAPRVLLLASGDELVWPGEGDETRGVVNSAAFGVAGLVEDWGGEARFGPILPDVLDDATDRLRNALEGDADLIVTIGGASVGDRDVLREAAMAAGYTIDFAGVAVRPGKPVWSATRAGHPRIIGLPGNPASALVTSRLFLVPLLARMLGQDADRVLTPFPARLGLAVEANGFRESYLRARMTAEGDGELVVWPADSQDSSRMTPFVEGAVLVHRGSNAAGEDAGATVSALAMQPDALRPKA